MEWMLFAITAAIVWSFASICDKILVSRFVSDGISAGILTNLFSAVLILFLLPFAQLQSLPFGTILLLLLTGAFWGWNRLAYVKGISLEEATRVVAIGQLSPLFILLASVFVFGEVLGWHDIIAFAFILGGILWISIKKGKGGFRISKAMAWMVFSAMLFAFTTLLLKYSGTDDWWTTLFWLNIGFALGSLPLLTIPRYFLAVKAGFLKNPLALPPLLLLLNAFTISGRATYFIALESGPAAIVSVLSSLQIVFVLIIMMFFTYFAPSILKEEHSPRVLMTKIGAITLILLGIVMLYLG